MELSFEQFLEVVDSATNQDQAPEVIQEANNIIYEFREKDTAQFLIYCAEIVLLENVSDIQATLGIVYIKSVLRQNRYYGIDYIIQLWSSIPEEQRMQLKQALIRGIMFPVEELRNSAASTLAIIAQLEFPDQWPDFLNVLVTLCQDESCGESTIMGTLQTLGDAFMSSNFIRPRYQRERENALKIVCELVFQVLQQEAEAPLKSAAVILLVNSFKTTFSRNFDKNADLLAMTFQILLENFEIEDEQLHSYIYDFFMITFKKLYNKIFPNPVTEIAQAVSHDLQSDILEYRTLALSFLRKCSKFELEQSKTSHRDVYFTETCSQNLAELIIPFLVFIDDNYDIDEADKSLSYFAYRTLKSFVKFDAENLFALVQEYFAANNEDSDWKTRCSTVIALRAILDVGNDIEKYVWSIFTELLNLTQDQNIIVRLHAQKFIASFVKRYSIIEDPVREVQFIIEIFTELVQQDIAQTISGCKIIINFIGRYDEKDYRSPLADEEIFNSILKPLWEQFNRPEIVTPSLYNKVKQAICKLCRKTPYSTMEIRKAFCIEVLERFRENANTLYSSPNVNTDMVTMQSIFLEIFGQVIYTIQGLFVKNDENEQLMNDIFDYLSQFLPKMNEIPNLIKTIGNLIITAPMHSGRYAETLVRFLIDAQSTREVDLITESAMTMGDLFRACPEEMHVFSDQFCSMLLDNIEDDNLPDPPVCQSIMTLADVVKLSNPDDIIGYRDRMMAVVRNYTHYKYNPDNPGDVEVMTNYLEGTIYLSGAILKTFSNDEEFISDRSNIEILFEFRLHITPDVFKSENLDYSLILFLNCALFNHKAARIYNIFLNHYNIKDYLQKIMDKSKNVECQRNAKKLKARIINA